MAASRGQALAALLCACLLLAGAASGGRVDVEDMLMMDRFIAWQAAYNRSYATAAERLRRFEVYRRNMELIEDTNRLGLSYQLGETPFTDLTSDEFLATHTMPLGLAGDAAAVPELITTLAGRVSERGGISYWNDTDTVDIPGSVDWRTKGAVTPPKDQGDCGCCWAFATVATIEGLHKIKTGKLVSLSEQELVDCSTSPPNRGCDGGNPVVAMEWVVDNGGLATESEYPYEARKGSCKTRINRAVKISDVMVVDPNNEAALEIAVAQQPVAVFVDGAEPSLQHYKSGVYQGPCDPEKLNHVVTVVGYGAEPRGRRYWIVKNSWADKWGEKGYFRLERRVKDKRGMCGVARFPSFPVM